MTIINKQLSIINYLFLPVLFILFYPVTRLNGQNTSQVREYEEEYVTYPFSDPNPNPVFGKIYPYFRYDGYTTQSVKKKWKIVELENDFLKIRIFPEIGGKIWSVYDKTTDNELFYDNKVVKFRDISLRGPWTSGGIEFNYGVIGHAPSCSFPVDYRTVQNPDGSVSCFISDLDLLTRTRWTVEINLPKDKGWFTTRSFWHNATGGSQPYYNWVNTGVTASEDLKIIYPGIHNIGHGGEVSPWPIDPDNGKDLSVWAENNFGDAKSYHIAGTSDPYFGVYWANRNVGMMHYANRDEKVGKKMFTWALSDAGDIWEDLLTDTNGQYIEVQSGRLFNQNVVTSSLTPFKQFYFAPYATDEWTEYWFPFRMAGEVSSAGLYGVVNVTEKNSVLDIAISPVRQLNDTLKFYDAEGGLLLTRPVSLSVAKPYAESLSIPGQKEIRKITLCNQEIWSRDSKDLNRPVEKDKEFDWETAYGKYLRGRDLSGFRLYDQAEVFIRESLALDGHFIPSLVELSRLHYRRMDYNLAYRTARKALSIDTYDPDANFEYGRSARKLNREADALDGFEIAALTTNLRSAAYTEISKIHFIRKNDDKATEYARKSLINNSYNIEGLQMLYLCYSRTGDMRKAEETAGQIVHLDPFNLFILFEKNYRNSSLNKNMFVSGVRSEMPAQAFLELAMWYNSLNMKNKSVAILKASPADGEIKYWLAWLHRDTPEASAYLKEADAQSAYYVFPFREESREVFEWAVTKTDSWKPLYYLALLQGSAHNTDQAKTLLAKAGDAPDFPPFYSLRAKLSSGDADTERDLKKALSLEPKEWRYVDQLTRYYLSKYETGKALQTVKPFYERNKSHFQTGSLYIRTLVYNKQYGEAEKVTNNIFILPFEGERGGRIIYREIKTMLAIQALDKGKTREAQKKLAESLEWPRNMGVGKPYDDLIDTRLEDWISALIAMKAKDTKNRDLYLKQTAHSTHRAHSPYTLLQSLAFSKLGDKGKAEELFNKWYAMQQNNNTKEWGERFYKANRDKDYPFDFEGLSQLIGLTSGTQDVRLF